MKKYNPWPSIILFLCVLILALVFMVSQAEAVSFIYIEAPSGGAETGTWETVWTSPNSPAEFDNGDDWNERNLVTSAQTAGGGPWTKVRVTFDPGSDGHTGSAASICIQDSADSCVTTPTQITVGSSSTWTADQDTLSDEITFSFDTDDSLLCHFYSPDGVGGYFFSGSYTQYYGSGSNDTLVQSPAYPSDTYTGTCVLIEGFNPD